MDARKLKNRSATSPHAASFDEQISRNGENYSVLEIWPTILLRLLDISQLWNSIHECLSILTDVVARVMLALEAERHVLFAYIAVVKYSELNQWKMSRKR